jgi:hypothetical protein
MNAPSLICSRSLAALLAGALAPAILAQNGAWTDEGFALAGTLGPPSLRATPAQYGRMLNLHADGVAVWALSVCVIGTSRLQAPVFGGVVVPEPIVVLNGTPSPSDRQHYRLLLPDVCVGSPVELFAQVLVFDAGAPQGWAISNAISTTVRDQVPSDFNGDGFSDLAIGVPDEDVGGLSDAGAVNVIYGSAAGLATADNVLLRPNKFVNGLLGNLPRSDAHYGEAVATGDFNGDGYDDLAVGARGDTLAVGGTSYPGAGSVQVIYGSPIGLQGGSAGPDDQLLMQGGWVGDSVGSHDLFGRAVAAGDYDGDGFDDLAIGAPGEDLQWVDAGVVHIVYGSATGLVHAEVSADPAGDGFQEFFGDEVLFADLNGDGLDELVASKPYEDGVGGSFAGGVAILRRDIDGNVSSIDVHRDSVFNGQAVQGDTGAGDLFGSSLAAADFARDGAEDLVVGVRGDRIAGAVDAGSVHLFRFVPGGIVPFDDSIWHQDTPGVLGTADVGERFGAALTIYDHDQDGLPDLVVGAYEERLFGIVAAGGVHVLRGSTTTGLTATNDTLMTYPGLGLGPATAGMFFGYALTAGRYFGTCDEQLVIGIPHAEVNGVDAGAVAVVDGGLPVVLWSQAPLNGLLNAGDRFGWSLGGGP